MSTDVPDPDDDPYAFSNGLMPYDVLESPPRYYAERLERGDRWGVFDRETGMIVTDRLSGRQVALTFASVGRAIAKCDELNGEK